MLSSAFSRGGWTLPVMLLYCCAFRSFSASVEYTAVIDAISFGCLCLRISLLGSSCKYYLELKLALAEESQEDVKLKILFESVESVKKNCYHFLLSAFHVPTQYLNQPFKYVMRCAVGSG